MAEGVPPPRSVLAGAARQANDHPVQLGKNERDRFLRRRTVEIEAERIVLRDRQASYDGLREVLLIMVETGHVEFAGTVAQHRSTTPIQRCNSSRVGATH